MDHATPAQLPTGRFFGTILKSARAVDAQLSLVRHDHARHLPPHEHESAYFCLLLHGSYTEHYGTQSIDYKPFMMAFHPPHFSHSDEIATEGGLFFLVELYDPWTTKLSAAVDFDSVKVELRGNEMVWLTMRIFKEFIEDLTDESALHIESLLYELIASAARLPDTPDREPAWFGAALRCLDARFTETLSMKTIADAAGVHPVTLARAFRRNLHQTASEYVNRLRVRRACEMLLGGKATIASISADCGFIDQSYFTKVFRGVTGATPAAFRETLRQAAAQPAG